MDLIYHDTILAYLFGMDGRAARRLAGRDALGLGPVERHPPLDINYTPVSCESFQNSIWYKLVE